jgi:hypothetical protein
MQSQMQPIMASWRNVSASCEFVHAQLFSRATQKEPVSFFVGEKDRDCETTKPPHIQRKVMS